MTVSTTLAAPVGVGHDQGMDSPLTPRAGGRSRRRAFTPAQKLEHLTAYEQACEERQGGAYLRANGLYSSQVTEWRKQRDAGLLDPNSAGRKVGRPTAEQAEIAKLRRQLATTEQRLARTEVALQIMGKTHELLEDLSKSSPTEPKDKKS